MRLLSAITMLLSFPLASAQVTPLPASSPPDLAYSAVLDPITVTATKTERLASEVPATVEVIDAGRMQRELAEDLRDLFRYEPGVTVPYQGSRFGNAGIVIRGLGGNRVQTEVDGVTIADNFAIGSFTNAGRDFVDLDTLKRVEIVRGPASSIYGSDALGGVVTFTTRDPRDLLDSAQSPAGSARLGYVGADQTRAASAIGAAARGSWSGLLSVVRREGEELDNKGDVGGEGAARTEPNPLDSRGSNVLAKLLWNEGGNSPLRLTVDRFELDTDSAAPSAIGSTTTGTTTTAITAQTADDEALRERISLDQQLDAVPGLNHLHWRLYSQRSRTRQDTFEARTVSSSLSGTSSDRERERRALFEQQVIGGELTAARELGSQAFRHRLVVGLEIERTESEQSRDGLERNLTAGTQTSVVGPDSFPVRDFPTTEVLEAGFYLQDDLSIGRFTVIPGLRLDYYDLEPRPDATFIDDNPGVMVEGLSETRLSPKLGLIAVLTESTSFYAQYAEGFRAPPYNDVNVGFTNLAFGYTAIPNPDLKPETSNGIELGLRGRGRDWGYQLAAFRNDYEDFIESLVALGVDPESGLLVFQSQNLSEVRINGLEVKGQLGLGRIDPALRDFALRGSAAYARGDDRSAGQPLNSVEPLTGVLGLSFTPAEQPLSLELLATATESKGRVDDSAGALYRSPGGVRWDALAQWTPHPRVELNLGLFNLTDRRIYAWSDVQGRSAGSVNIDRFTQPGLNASFNLRLRF